MCPKCNFKGTMKNENKLLLIIIILLISITYLIYKNLNFEEKRYKLETSLSLQEKFNNDLINKININRINTYFLTLTAYTLTKEECNKDLKNTAIMQKPIAGYTCAVSQDLLKLLGRKIYIKGFGVFYVNDLMNKRFKNSIDILVGNKKTAFNIGKQFNIEVVLIEQF